MMEKKEEIELRSEEVQEIMGEIPAWIVRRGITVLFVVMAALLCGSYFFRYPSVATTTMTLTNRCPVAEIYACHTGRITELYVNNGEMVKKGVTLAVIENSAETSDVFLLKQMIAATEMNPQNLIYELPKRIMKLGTIQSAYSALAVKSPDDPLYASAWGALVDAVNSWEMTYCIMSTEDGHVEFQKSDMRNRQVETGKLVARIIPSTIGEWIGRAELSIAESGKVTVGKRVIVRFMNYNDSDYGIIEGRVLSIAKLPFEDSYELEISFPEGFTGSFGKQIEPAYGMKAAVEIIKEDIRLLEHFFQPLRKLMNKTE